MSSIYIQEPPTFGKVLLVTSVGDIDIELWAKEAPKACRNFVQLCMEGYYNGTIFHRIVKEFICQGGDPTGTGEGGESIYGEPFKDEFHSRLRFSHRGLVAMANAGANDNSSQFFFTFAATPELQNKHTIFGKVTGETVYNMLKLENAETDSDDRPTYPQKIIKAEILNNPFPDIVPRTVPEKKEKKKKSEKKISGVKNFKLLSFGAEAEEDEVETTEINLTFAGRSKSTHDVLDDPKLSSVPAVDDLKGDVEVEDGGESDVEEDEGGKERRLEAVKNKLKRTRDKDEDQKEESEEEYYLGKAEEERKKQRLAEIRKEIKDLKREYQKDAKEKSEADESEEPAKQKKEESENEMIADYKSNLTKYSTMKNKVPLKGSSREAFTLQLLQKFQKKLEKAKEDQEERGEGVEEGEEKDDDDSDEKWLTHKLTFETAPVLAKDANTKNDEWFDITDPRNPINKRRREMGKNKTNK